MNQGKLEVVKQEMARVNVDIHSCQLLFDYSQFTLIHGPNIPGSCVILLFTALDFTFITSHIRNWVLGVLFCFVLFCFVFGSILTFFLELFLHWSPVAYWALTDLGSLSFSPIFLLFHTDYGVLKGRMLKWFAIPFSSGPHSVSPLHHDPSILETTPRTGSGGATHPR